MLGFRLHRQIKTSDRSRLNLSLSGISESIKLSDKVTFNTREGLTVRLGNGVSWRSGKLF